MHKTNDPLKFSPSTPTKQHILYIHQHFKLPSESGGTRSWEFSRRLVAEGHQVVMLCGGSGATVNMDGVNIIRLGTRYANKMSMTRRAVSFIQFSLKATLEAWKTPADIVLATSTPLTVAIPAIIHKLRWRSRYIFEVRDLWPTVPIELGIIRNRAVILGATLLEKTAYRAADHIIALSDGMAAGVRQVDRSTPITVVPNASDRELFMKLRDRENTRAALSVDATTTLFVYAGSLGQLYNVEWMIHLAHAMRDQPVRFIVLGGGKTLDASRSLAKKLGLDEQQLLPGPVPKEQVPAYASAADIMISSLDPNPVLEASSLNKVFDALAAAKPVLFNHSGWLAEQVCDAGAGWKVNQDPDIAAAQVQSKILGCPAQIQAAGDQARRLAETRFDRDLLFNDFKDVLLETHE